MKQSGDGLPLTPADVLNCTAILQAIAHHTSMRKMKPSDAALLARLKKQLAKPRLSKSVRENGTKKCVPARLVDADLERT